MAGTDEPSPREPIQLNEILGISNSNGPTSLDLGNNDDLDEFGTPLNTFEAPKTANILHNGEIAAASGTQAKTSRVLFTDVTRDAHVPGPSLAAISEVNNTPDQVPTQPDLGTSPRARNIARAIALHEPGIEKGYDSDGDIGPFWDALEDEGEQEEPLYEEEEATKVANEESIIEVADDEESEQEETTTELATTITTKLTTTPAITTTNDTGRGHTVIEDDLIVKMLRPAIAIELKKRDLSVKGKKEVLQERLKQAMKDKVPVVISNFVKSGSKKGRRIRPRPPLRPRRIRPLSW